MGLLTGRVAIVTGASSGIGAASARALADEGCSVVLAARRVDRLEALAAEISAKGVQVVTHATDVTDEDAVLSLFRTTAERFNDRLDVLVNSAGVSGDIPIEELSLADWRRVIDANLTSAYLCSRQAFLMMKPRGRGRIINIGSASAKVPRKESPAYAASKYGIAGLTHALAIDGREHGIAVSVLHPGFTQTEISPRAAVATPGHNVMASEDIGRMVCLMASLPDGTNLYEGTAVPLGMAFLARG
jgi:NAD(P)-dependent dehydrogenase (short-subunit alcohol dehydrogenase family)